MLDADIQDELVVAYRPGQAADGRLTRKRWHKVMTRARYSLGEED